VTPRALQHVLVTGGCGFIGSNFIRHLLVQPDFHGRVVNVDALTYAGNPANLAGLDAGERYRFEHADVCDATALRRIFATHEIDTVVHLAAETHVDRSILDPATFFRTNASGTLALLEVARAAWKDRHDVHFHHVSTDEVYGSLGPSGHFLETSRYAPRSPYAASKAAADHLVRAHGHTYGLSTTISSCSNNYGPYQFPEKLIPLMILRMLEGESLPVYGDGGHVRDWLYVEDHAHALWTLLRAAPSGGTWNVGGGNEWRNVDLVHLLCDLVAARTGRDPSALRALVRHVQDRPGHDRRYALDCAKIERDLDWTPAHDFAAGLEATVDWYLAHLGWVDAVRDGSYRTWIETNYGARS
jgi:dTDP-glucose 4,6-dehydratase